jgi:hypothetical protein
MVISLTGSQAPNILAAPPAPHATPAGSTSSFTSQLAAELEGFLSKSANGSHLQIDIQTTQSQDSGVRQFIVTVKDPSSAVVSAKLSEPAVASAVLAPTASPATGSSTSAPMDDATKANLSRSEIDAYWAAQPVEVQQLRNVTDFGARSAMAQDLADKGYTIDRAIMVWGWDPMKTMAARGQCGYTWVPNLNQATPSTGPAFALSGQTPYDANNPPPGSIAVNTDFAKGLGITDPWAL